METVYIPLTRGQISKLRKALTVKAPTSLRLSHGQLKSLILDKAGAPIMLTNQQKVRAVKSYQSGKGMMLNLSLTQIKKMASEGGILPILAALAPVAIALLSGAAGAVGTFGANKIIKKLDKSEGKGLFPIGPQPFSGKKK